MMKRWRLLLGVVLALTALAVLGALGSLRYYDRLMDAPLVGVPEEATIEVAPGATVRSVARELGARGWLAHPRLLELEARRQDVASRIRAGEYAVSVGESPRGLLARLVAGDTLRYRVTIVEGQRFRQALEIIRAHPKISVVQPGAVDQLTDAELIAMYDLPFPHPEGALFPDTYLFERGTTDVALVRQARDRLVATLGNLWSEFGDGSALDTPYEALVLASIVEKETGLAAERPAIAGVFMRRLAKGMLLQTDPTVIYGVGADFDGNLTRRHLETDTPYNTYTRAGLPPSPIALVGEAALRAALAPEDGDSLYFVAKGDGSHQFSRTYAEHRRAVRQYQLGRKPSRTPSTKESPAP